MDNKVEDMDEEKLQEMSLEVERMMNFIQSKKVYKCTHPGCKAVFDRPYRLAQHILAHNNIRPFHCNEPDCGKAYTSKSHLDRHCRSVHRRPEHDIIYSCSRCFKTFANRQNLKRHINTVHKVEYSCAICSLHFKKKNQLKAHMYLHTGVKAFSCDQCPETFVSLYLKKRHMRYHKTYNCQECGVEFNHWSKYQHHLKADHLKIEFICDECGKSFNKRSHIVRHVKIHAGLIRTFMCPYQNCERTYSRNSNLKQHILVKHLDVLHECTICNSRLSTKAKLNYHMQLHYTSGSNQIPSRSANNQRRERKDQGSFKTSTALKLSGLSETPDDINSLLAIQSQAPHGDRSSDANFNEADVTQDQEDDTSPPINMEVKTEYIEIEVDIPCGF